MKNTIWAKPMHWKTKRLIRQQPILKSTRKRCVYWQKVIIESELEHIKWLEENTDQHQNHLFLDYVYKLQLQYALAQLNLL
jgi:hypothetical protein